MSNSKSDIEIEWLRSVSLHEIVKKENNSIKENDLKVKDIKINFIGEDEAFMLTTCYRASISYEYAGVEKNLSLVVKKTPPLPVELYDSINFNTLFQNEIQSYTEIFPAIERFTKTKLDIPKYFYSELNRSSATLVLEDFGLNGWSVAKTKYDLSLEHILRAAEYIGNFHGIGFAWRKMQPENFERLTNLLGESRFAHDDPPPEWGDMMKSSVKRVAISTKKYQPNIEDEFVQRLVNLISDFWKYGKWRVAPREPLVTLCHADYLRNNIAYNYGNENSKDPTRVIMFDLQTMRLSSPILDLSVLLLASSFNHVRHAHFSEIFSAYCNKLKLAYETHTNSQLPEFLSETSLLREYIKFFPYGIAINASFLMTLVEPFEIPIEEMMVLNRTPEEIEEDTLRRGGEVVDIELAAQVKELYDLSHKYDVDFTDGFKLPV